MSFRVGLSGEFWDGEGRPCHPGVEFGRLEAEPVVEVVRLPYRETATAGDFADLDAVLSFWCRVHGDAVGPDSRSRSWRAAATATTT